MINLMIHNFHIFRSTKIKFVVSALLPLLLIACSSEGVNKLSQDEKAEGWQLLFDGNSMDEWRGLGRDQIPEGHWTIENNSLKKIASGDVPRMEDGQPVAGGDIMTKDTFNNFELSFEWRISEGGNSGVKYNVSEEISTSIGGRHSALGFEYQIIDDVGYPGNLQDAQKAGALYDLIPPGENKELKPAGEYNHSRIILNNNMGEHWLNGVKVLEYELGTPHMDSLIAESKFNDIPEFGKKKDGHIVIQDHVDAAWYRNIKIRTLSD